MFFSRYLRLTRSDPDSAISESDRTVRNALSEVELADIRTQVESPRLIRPRIIGVNAPEETEVDDYDEFVFEESPSPSAVVAVRICVWAFFLFGFLILFHNQQERFMADRTKPSSRLRSSQLIHVPIAWTDSSGFETPGTSFHSQFICSDPQPLSISSHNSGGRLTINRKIGVSGVKFDGMPPSTPIVATQADAVDVFHVQKKSGDTFSFEYNNMAFGWKSSHDPLFFKFLKEQGLAYVVTNSASDSVDCVSRYNSSQCIDSKPIRRSKSYFYDNESKFIVSVGTESPLQGQSRGVFVQAYDPQLSTVNTSFLIPFINRYDEGLWVFQNSPMTDGFIVLLPVIGFPPAPVQHLVVLRDIAADVPQGTVLRMENASLRLFRKVDTVGFTPILNDNPCSC